MNKYLKHLLWLGLLGLSSSAYAEGGCPNGMTPVNNGQNWTCIPGGNDSPTQQQAAPSLPRPTGHWVKTWGGIATSPNEGALGVAVGANSKREAEHLALNNCKAKGGKKCEVDMAYHNQCAVMIVGKNKLKIRSAESIKIATQIGMEDCQKNDTNCRVYYSACTEPYFVKH